MGIDGHIVLTDMFFVVVVFQNRFISMYGLSSEHNVVPDASVYSHVSWPYYFAT